MKKTGHTQVMILASAMAILLSGCNVNVNTHTHTFATEWTSNATHHWYAATCEHTAEVKDKAEHTFGGWTTTLEPTETTEGSKERECSVCAYKVTEIIAKLDHTHTFATEWTSNATDHWYAATCEHTAEVKDKAEHTFGEWTSNNDATKNVDGTKSRMCSVCQYKETVTDTGSKLPKAVGDFILKDGTVLSKDETPERGTVAAVIVRAAADGKPALGVGIVHNSIGLAWCTSSAAGFNTYITGLKGDKTSGYMVGSEGWEILKAACSDADAHPEYYPAWKYCLDYATTNGLEGDLANGWYLPTLAELYTIYQNKTTIDASLSKADGSQFGTSFYWSCCQYPSTTNYAWILCFNNGNMHSNYKFSYHHYVCSVRAFN